jgi:hypothetical protein
MGRPKKSKVVETPPTVTPEVMAEAEVASRQAIGALRDITELSPDVETLEALCVEAQDERARLDSVRCTLKSPHLDAGRAVDSTFRDALESLGSLIDVCKERMAAHWQSLTHYRAQREWGFIVREFADLPSEFKQVDEKALKSYIRMRGGVCDIPGVEITESIRLVRKSLTEGSADENTL